MALRTTPLGRVRAFEYVLRLAVVSGQNPPNLDLSHLKEDTSVLARILSNLWELHLGHDRGTDLPKNFEETRGADEEVSADVESLARLLEAWELCSDGDSLEAIDLLKPALAPGPWKDFEYVRPLLEWTMGDLYEGIGALDSAAVHFQRLAAFPLYGPDNPLRGLTHSFAHHRAAFLYGRLGQAKDAKRHREVFLRDFSDPDPELEWRVEEAQATTARSGDQVEG